MLGDSLRLPQTNSLNVLSMLLVEECLAGVKQLKKNRTGVKKWPEQSHNLIGTCHPSFPAKGGWS